MGSKFGYKVQVQIFLNNISGTKVQVHAFTLNLVQVQVVLKNHQIQVKYMVSALLIVKFVSFIGKIY